MGKERMILNMLPFSIKPTRLFSYSIILIDPQTSNKKVRFRLAANIAKSSTRNSNPAFNHGEGIFSTHEVEKEHFQDLEVDGEKKSFRVVLSDPSEIILNGVCEEAAELLNKLVDSYYLEFIPNSFHMKGANYVGENIFRKSEASLYRAHKLNINQGIFRAARVMGNRLFLVLDVDYRVNWEEDLWYSVKRYARALEKDIDNPDDSLIQAVDEKFGRTKNKRGMYLQGKNRRGKYEVLRFEFDKNPKTPNTAGDMNQMEYFKKVYDIDIKDKKQPLVRVAVIGGPYHGCENYHVPELLLFTKMPHYLGENQRVMSAKKQLTAPPPRVRYSAVLEFIEGDPMSEQEGFSQDKFTGIFADIGDRLLEKEAAVMDPITLKMGGKTFSVSSNKDFLKIVATNKFHRIPIVHNLTLIYMKDRESDVIDFYGNLRDICQDNGLVLPQDPKMIALERESYKTYHEALEDDHDTDIVLSFMSRSNDDLYKALKKDLLVNYGTLSQNITYERTIDVLAEYLSSGKKFDFRAILLTISSQICAKLGGAPWAFNDPIYEENCPVVGIDILYSNENEPIVGAIAVFDPYGEYLFSKVERTASSGIGSPLRDLLKEMFEEYSERYGTPERILLIRDGLNYTQENKFVYGETGEISIISTALSEMGIMDFVFVMEKKNSRLRMYKKIDDYQVENPPSGSYIVGDPFDENEILMVSQEALTGTADPVLYRVLSPENPDMLKIANALHKLCQHHWNKPGSTRLPAPAFHADEITWFTKNVLHDIPRDSRVLDRPFYL